MWVEVRNAILGLVLLTSYMLLCALAHQECSFRLRDFFQVPSTLLPRWDAESSGCLLGPRRWALPCRWGRGEGKEPGFLMPLWCCPTSPRLLASGLHLNVREMNSYLTSGIVTHAGNFLRHHPAFFPKYLLPFDSLCPTLRAGARALLFVLPLQCLGQCLAL